MTIIMVLHDINHARMYADDIVIIKDKQVFAQGSPQNTLNPDNLANVFGGKSRYLPKLFKTRKIR